MKRLRAVTVLAILIVAQSDVCCAQWVPTNYPEAGNGISNLTQIGAKIFAASTNVLYVSTNSGNTWMQTDTNFSFDGLQAVGTYLFGGAGYGGYRSMDSGKTWEMVNSANTSQITFAGSGATLFSGSYGRGVYRSTDSGSSWVPNWTRIGSLGNVVPTLAVTGMTIFAGCDARLDSFGVYYDEYGVFRSDNEANSWVSVSDGLPDSNVIALGLKDSDLYAGVTGNGVYRMANLANAWLPVNRGIERFTVNSILTIGHILLIGTEGHGVYVSSNGGLDWKDMNQGLTSINVYSIISDKEFVYIGTESTLWRRSLSDFGVSSVAQSQISPPQIQSYPNPFTQSTTITFSSQDEGYADVSVVNLIGVQVERIFSGELSAGEHSFTWDASGMAPGMYECIVRSNGQAQRISMILSEP